MASIFTALAYGYPSRVILNRIAQHSPKLAQGIDTALAAGYTADMVLQRLDSGKSSGDKNEEYMTDHEKAQKAHRENNKKAYLTAIGALGTAGAIAAGGYALATRNRAVRPSAILPASQPQIPPPQGPITLQGGRRPPQLGLPGRPRPGLPAPTAGLPAPQQPIIPPPQPAQPRGNQQLTPNTPQAQQFKQNVDLVHNLNEQTRFSNIVQQGHDPLTTAAILRQVIPKGKLAILEKSPGGLEQIVTDYLQYQQAQPPAVRERPQASAQAGIQPPAVQEQALQQLPEEQIQPEQAVQTAPMEQLEQVAQTEEIAQSQMSPEYMEMPQRVSQAAFGPKKLRTMEEYAPLKRGSFSVPNYHYKGESKEEFDNRKILFDAINKGAKALLEGKSFLDFPINKEAIKARGGYSTAQDVLMFMAGIPNIYDPLLDDEEREELSNALLESGEMTTSGLAPTSGERNIHGAQLAPNLVWNLLLSVEPKISMMEKPPSIKGYKMAPGKKMGTTELRRFLTHSVYGALSGHTISNELADKIGKISRISDSLDVLAHASKAGNMRKIENEMEAMMDDEYFLQIMSQELPSMISEKESEEATKEDTKMAASIKAEGTRKKKKAEKVKGIENAD